MLIESLNSILAFLLAIYLLYLIYKGIRLIIAKSMKNVIRIKGSYITAGKVLYVYKIIIILLAIAAFIRQIENTEYILILFVLAGIFLTFTYSKSVIFFDDENIYTLDNNFKIADIDKCTLINNELENVYKFRVTYKNLKTKDIYLPKELETIKSLKNKNVNIKGIKI